MQEQLQAVTEAHLLIVGNGMNFIDIAGAEMLTHEAQRRRSAGGGLYLTNLKQGARDFLKHSGYLETFGQANIFDSKGQAIGSIYHCLEQQTCQNCHSKIFQECRGQPLNVGAEER